MSAVVGRMFIACAACLMIGSIGCARWTTKPVSDTSIDLPLPPMAPDSVVLEVAFVHFEDNAGFDDQQLWSEVDEQHVPIELRRRLEANGFRCGLVGSPLPTALRQLVDAQHDQSAGDLQAGESFDEITRQQRKQMRTGRRGEIVATTTRQSIAVLRMEGDAIRGKTYENAQCRFALRPVAEGDGTARIELIPEIHHGAMRQRWVGDQRAFRLDAGQDQVVFDELSIEAGLSPGQTLIVACTPDAKGLGRSFFVEEIDGKLQKRLLLIRLAQTQLDDRFAAGGRFSPSMPAMP